MCTVPGHPEPEPGSRVHSGEALVPVDAHQPCLGSQMRVLTTARRPVPQLVCTYDELRFASIRLPGCPPGVDPVVSFPVALSCHCGTCRLSNSDCGGLRGQPSACELPHLPGFFFL